MNQKTLKVCYASRMSTGYHHDYSSVPKINMEGKWLEELGFHIGDRVNIEYDEGIIRITPAPEEVLMVAEPAASFISKKSSKKSQRNILR